MSSGPRPHGPRQAFDVLRAASQDSNRKQADIAVDVVDTGTLTIRGWPVKRRARLAPPYASG